jgi:hypothetical protein
VDSKSLAAFSKPSGSANYSIKDQILDKIACAAVAAF